jgi:hypothetical protein
VTSRFESLCRPGGPLKQEPADEQEIAALRCHGYRPAQRYIVFQLLEDTLGLPPKTWRVLDESHRLRNLAEYEGELNATVELVEEMIAICATLIERLDDAISRTFPRRR